MLFALVANMGRKERTEDYFRKRLRVERELKGWSQSDVAKMLSDNGTAMHSTTIAKIEAGDRNVRIDEATAISDLFEVSLDGLLGRKGIEDDQSHALSVLADEAQKVLPDLMQIRERVWRAYQDLQAQWDFHSLDAFVAQGATWSWDGLSLEHKRALLAWNIRGVATDNLTTVIYGAYAHCRCAVDDSPAGAQTGRADRRTSRRDERAFRRR